MFLAHRPSGQEVTRFLAASRRLPLSYAPPGLATTGGSGFRTAEEETTIGSGIGDFTRAVTALTEWRHFDLGWVELFPARAAVAPGTLVAVAIAHLGFWSLNGCRVVYSTSEAGGSRFGFAYGTLANHAECGEEIFEVRLDAHTGDVSYRIRAVSRPRAALAKLGFPYARLLQARFRRESALAVRRAIDGR